MRPLHLCPLPETAGALSNPLAPIAVLVTVHRVQGSAPREVGCQMVVTEQDFFGTVGGGHLEWVALESARSLLGHWLGTTQTEPIHPQIERFALGPSMGQCCGGVVWLEFAPLGRPALSQLVKQALSTLPKLSLFGGGHVGAALVRQLHLLDFCIHWVDSRDAVFPDDLAVSNTLSMDVSEPVEAAVKDIAADSHVLIMSFSHAEDFAVLEACLRRQRERGDLAFIGLIGSKTKWATFSHRLLEKGYKEAELAQVTCPIGIPQIAGKAPAQIALSVAAQLMERLTKVQQKP